jgi:hypothetical protein
MGGEGAQVGILVALARRANLSPVSRDISAAPAGTPDFAEIRVLGRRTNNPILIGVPTGAVYRTGCRCDLDLTA